MILSCHWNSLSAYPSMKMHVPIKRNTPMNDALAIKTMTAANTILLIRKDSGCTVATCLG